MSEMSGVANIRRLGSRCTTTLIVAIVMAPAAGAIAQDSTYYFTCSYSNDSWETNIKISKVDLSAKEIIATAELNMRGEIAYKTPLNVAQGNQQFLLVATNDGEAAKNSEFQDRVVCNYSILDRGLNTVLTGQLPGITLLGRWLYSPHQGSLIDYSLETDHSFVAMKGRLGLDRARRLNIAEGQEYHFIDAEYPSIGGFRFFKRIRQSNDRLYWVVANSGVYLLILDLNQRSLIDSLNIGNNMDYSYLFAISSDDSLIYSFHVNSNVVGGPEDQQKLIIDPSFLMKYNSSTLHPVDSIAIQYPSLDSGYTFAELGLCDWVGPNLVYYFFLGEDYCYFSPAMLFIFDTRTNEATWLRVGWR